MWVTLGSGAVGFTRWVDRAQLDNWIYRRKIKVPAGAGGMAYTLMLSKITLS